ncbi:MAG: MFS transporter [Acidobacteria bacterium]|nr:MFS transporter [Acidobacteriota bacterium]
MPKPSAPPGWLERLGLHRPELRAWAMYDWANSAFWTTVIAAVFPAYFVRTAAFGMDPSAATSRLALASAAAIGIVAVISPVLGAIADYAALKKRLLGAFLCVAVASTGALWFVGQGDWRLALWLFVIGNIASAANMTFYDSLLPHIASAEEVDVVSSSAYAIGYLGGGLLLVINLLWIAQPGWFGIPDAGTAARLSFVSVAVWWAVFSIPLFRRVPEPPPQFAPGVPHPSVWTVAFSRLSTTFHELRSFKHAFLLLVAFAIYNDGINTIIRMASAYGSEIGIPEESLLPVFVVVQFAGVPFAFMFGRLATHITAKRAVLLSLAVYTGISIFGYFVSTIWHFYILGIAVAMVQGGSQALSRSMFSTMIPKHKSSEFFSFFGIFEKFAGILGPLVFGIVAQRTGTSRPAIVALIPFFAIGAYLLNKVDVAEGQKAARAAEAHLLE